MPASAHNAHSLCQRQHMHFLNLLHNRPWSFLLLCGAIKILQQCAATAWRRSLLQCKQTRLLLLFTLSICTVGTLRKMKLALPITNAVPNSTPIAASCIFSVLLPCCLMVSGTSSTFIIVLALRLASSMCQSASRNGNRKSV